MIYPTIGTDKNAREWNEFADAPLVDREVVTDPLLLEIAENTLYGTADGQNIVCSAPGILMPGGVAVDADALVWIEAPRFTEQLHLRG